MRYDPKSFCIVALVYPSMYKPQVTLHGVASLQVSPATQISRCNQLFFSFFRNLLSNNDWSSYVKDSMEKHSDVSVFVFVIYQIKFSQDEIIFFPFKGCDSWQLLLTVELKFSTNFLSFTMRALLVLNGHFIGTCWQYSSLNRLSKQTGLQIIRD